MPDEDIPTVRADDRNAPSIGETITLVKEYARQETLGPLKGAGRWIGVGAAGAILIAFGSALLVLGTLRAFQTEFTSFRGRWASLLPYVFALVVCVSVSAISFLRIRKPSLQKGRTR